jgi:alcohol dehydrogenase (NADP+)
MFDCAAIYGNEDLIGKVFAEAFEEGVVKREDLFIASKVWNDMHGKGNVLLSLAKTLRDLQLDYVDAYFVHWPFPNYHAPFCDGDSRNPDSKPFSVDEFMSTWRQMEHLYDLGLARNLGMSNMTIPKLRAVLPLCRVRPTVIEMELHPCFQQPELYDYALSQGIQPIGYCPVGSPNRPDRDTTPDDIADTQVPEVMEIARKHNVHPAIVCLKWAVQRGQIPIPFSVHEKNYIANLKCTTEDPLTDEEMEVLTAIDKNCRLIKGQVFLWEGANDWHDLWDEDGIITK